MEIQEIIEKIFNRYSANDILELLDDEILNWDYGYGDEEINEFESRWDFYLEHNNKEAEGAVIDQILYFIELNSNDVFDIDEGVSLTLFEEWLGDYTGHYFTK